jgi:hypothetical protein
MIIAKVGFTMTARKPMNRSAQKAPAHLFDTEIPSIGSVAEFQRALDGLTPGELSELLARMKSREINAAETQTKGQMVNPEIEEPCLRPSVWTSYPRSRPHSNEGCGLVCGRLAPRICRDLEGKERAGEWCVKIGYDNFVYNSKMIVSPQLVKAPTSGGR